MWRPSRSQESLQKTKHNLAKLYAFLAWITCGLTLYTILKKNPPIEAIKKKHESQNLVEVDTAEKWNIKVTTFRKRGYKQQNLIDNENTNEA